MSDAAVRPHEGEEAERRRANDTVPAPQLEKQSKMRRFFHRVWTGARFLWNTLSIIGTLLALAFQLTYPWGYKLPYGITDPGAPVWLSALVLTIVYAATKAPHFFGQEPGDWEALVREVVMCLVNFTIAVVYLTRVYDGIPHPPNAVGITLWFAIAFGTALVAEVIQGMILARRTWSDTSGPSH